jgi:hypothetical protein
VSVQHLERRVAANIKRLEEVRGVRRHAESDNLVILAKLIKLWCSIALMTVKDEKSVRALCTGLCVSVEVLHPLKAKLVGCPSIVAESDCPLWWEVLIPASLVELAS